MVGIGNKSSTHQIDDRDNFFFFLSIWFTKSIFRNIFTPMNTYRNKWQADLIGGGFNGNFTFFFSGSLRVNLVAIGRYAICMMIKPQ